MVALLLLAQGFVNCDVYTGTYSGNIKQADTNYSGPLHSSKPMMLLEKGLTNFARAAFLLMSIMRSFVCAKMTDPVFLYPARNQFIPSISLGFQQQLCRTARTFSTYFFLQFLGAVAINNPIKSIGLLSCSKDKQHTIFAFFGGGGWEGAA